MSYVVIGMTLATALVSARASYVQGQTAKKIGENNQKMAEYAAIDSLRRGELAAQEVRRRGDAIKSAQRARMAASGLDLNEGTAADLQDQVDFFSETDQATARLNAKKEAWQQRATGSAARFQGDSAATQGNLQAFATVLGTGSQVAGKWYQPTSGGGAYAGGQTGFFGGSGRSGD